MSADLETTVTGFVVPPRLCESRGRLLKIEAAEIDFLFLGDSILRVKEMKRDWMK
jgi:hypothetical protein